MSENFAEVQKAILLTLAYSAQFEHGLSVDLLHTRLVTKRPVSRTVFDRVIDLLLDSGIVYRNTNDLIQLSGVSIRSFPNIESKKEEIRALVSFISNIPWVQAVIITGSVAVGTMKPQDDIDFLIVTQSNRLWLVRPLVVLFGLFKGRRRSWSHEEPNSWCFNFWLEETELAFAKSRWSMYTAFELCQAKFVFDRNVQTELSFLLANTWVKDRLPHYFCYRLSQAKRKRQLVATNDETSLNKPQNLLTRLISFLDTLLGFIFTLLNYGFYLVQLFYMASHRTTEQVSLKFAFFHPRDTKKILYAGWKRSFKRLKKS
jgi:predicted nucleotidyltransferase